MREKNDNTRTGERLAKNAKLSMFKNSIGVRGEMQEETYKLYSFTATFPAVTTKAGFKNVGLL
jgi:hypothetical protein